MIQGATSDYLARLFVKAPAGFWHLHTMGIEPFMPGSVALDVETRAEVHAGRWIVPCPFCGGAQLGTPEMDRLLCVDCANTQVGGQWVKVIWPSAQDVAAIEAALLARPHVQNRSWLSNESIGRLLAENAEHGLFDAETGAVHGDVGADQMRFPGHGQALIEGRRLGLDHPYQPDRPLPVLKA